MDMTQGSIVENLVFFSIPLLIGNLLQQLYNMCDTWVIGKYGEDAAFAAVGNVGPITNIMVGLFLGFSTGAGVIISQYYGKGDTENVQKTVHTAVTLTIWLSVIMTAIGVLGTPLILKSMLHVDPADPETMVVYNYAKPYLTIYFAGIASLLFYNIGAGILRAIGDSVWPFIFLVISTVTNIALDLLFVAVFRWGVYGVAFATILAEFASAVAAMWRLMAVKNCVRLDLRKLKIDWKILQKITVVGLPAGLQTALTAFSNVFVQSYISGTNGVQEINMGAWTAYSKVDQLIFLPLQTLALSATTFVGQNLGVGNVKRARKGTFVAFYMAVICTAASLLPIEIFAPAIARFFKSNPEIVTRAALLLRCLSPFYFCSCVNQLFTGAMRGAGNSVAPMFIMLGNFVGMRQIYLFLMKKYVTNELLPIGWSYPFGWICCCITVVIYYKFFFSYTKNKLVE